MKKTILIFLCLSVPVLLAGCTKVEGPRVKVSGHTFAVEIADDAEEKHHGLSNRESLDQNTGMLFVFNKYSVQTFIMRDMKFELDVIWIKDNMVVGCTKNIPIYKSNGLFSTMNSLSPVNYVLEINAGLCDEYKIEAGDKVDINLE